MLAIIYVFLGLIAGYIIGKETKIYKSGISEFGRGYTKGFRDGAKIIKGSKYLQNQRLN